MLPAFKICLLLALFGVARTAESGVGNKCEDVNSAGHLKLEGFDTEIPSDKFERCHALKSVDLTGLRNLQTIGDGAFSLTQLTSVDFTSLINLQTIGDHAFFRTQITSVDFTSLINLQTIGDGAFYGTKLTSVDFTNLLKLKKIGMFAFDDEVCGINSPDLDNAPDECGRCTTYGLALRTFNSDPPVGCNCSDAAGTNLPSCGAVSRRHARRLLFASDTTAGFLGGGATGASWCCENKKD